MKVLVVDENEERAKMLCAKLTASGYTVFVDLRLSSLPLAVLIASYNPEMVLIAAESPSRALLDSVLQVSRDSPHPIVMFSGDSDAALARQAAEAGVIAYVVDGTEVRDLAPILEVASAQFKRLSSLQNELLETQQKLAERKLLERAKGLLMQQKGLSEDQAYHALRKLAMEKKMRLAQVAEQVVAVADAFR